MRVRGLCIYLLRGLSPSEPLGVDQFRYGGNTFFTMLKYRNSAAAERRPPKISGNSMELVLKLYKWLYIRFI